MEKLPKPHMMKVRWLNPLHAAHASIAIGVAAGILHPIILHWSGPHPAPTTGDFLSGALGGAIYAWLGGLTIASLFNLMALLSGGVTVELSELTVPRERDKDKEDAKESKEQDG